MVEVAAVAGLSVETLRKIEHGRIPTPAFFTVAAIADAVGLSLDTLAIAVAEDTENEDTENTNASGLADRADVTSDASGFVPTVIRQSRATARRLSA